MPEKFLSFIESDAASGMSILAGTDIRVLSVLETLFSNSFDYAETMREFPSLTRDQLEACVQWSRKMVA